MPNAFYRIMVDKTIPESPDVLAFIVGNRDLSGHRHGEFLASEESVEALTDLDFLSALPEPIENALEEHIPKRL